MLALIDLFLVYYFRGFYLRFRMEWGRLSEKSNIPQRESRIRFWPCVGVRSILVSRGLLGQPGGWAQKQFVRKNLPFQSE